MRKLPVKEYEFELGQRVVRVSIFKGDRGYWGHWECQGLQESTEQWYPSIRDASYMIRQHAELSLKETPK